MAESNPEMTQADLALWAKRHYGSSKPPSQTTISRILAKKDELISLKEHEFKLIRRRRLSNPLLRKVLLEWISQCVWNNIPITAPIIMSSASNFWNQLPNHLKEGNGEFSYKWCSQFLSKVNINLNNIENELYRNLKIWTFEERSTLRNYFNGIDLKKIFTLDEIFLSYDLPLDKSCYDDKSDFITCMLCVNADGSEKLDPLIIGRYENYPSFENKSSIKAATKHGVSYHSNRQKWLTSTVFYDWLSVLDKRLALQGKDIIILLDDSASHRVSNIKLQRIRLLFTSSSSNFLPMNWGVENDFRLTFRIKQYEQLISKQKLKKNKLLSKEEMRFSMVEIFDFIKKSWEAIPQSRIQSAWKQSGILPKVATNSFLRQGMFDDSLEIKLFHVMNELSVKEQWDVLSLLDLSVERKINKSFLSNEEIIQSSIVDNYDDYDHTDGEPKRAPFSHTLGQGLQRLQRLGEMHLAASQLNLDTGYMDLDDDFDFDDLHFDDPLSSSHIAGLDYSINMENTNTNQQHQQDQNMNQNMGSLENQLFQANGLGNDNSRQLSVDSTASSTHQPFSYMMDEEFKRDFASTSTFSPTDTQLPSVPHAPPLASSGQTHLSTLQGSAQQGQLGTTHVNGVEVTPNQKLLIIVNFLKLLEVDNDIRLSSETVDELKLLYYQYLNKVREQQQQQQQQ